MKIQYTYQKLYINFQMHECKNFLIEHFLKWGVSIQLICEKFNFIYVY
jgi:hypothetical protein